MIAPSIIKTMRLVSLIIIPILISHPGHAFEIEVKDQQLTAVADRVPMQDLLKRLAADLNIALKMDPAINPPVTVSLKNIDLELGLKTILQPHNHVLIWETNAAHKNDPSAPAHRLAQIHVFRPGEKSQMVDINVPPRTTPAAALTKPEVRTATKVTIRGNKVYVPVTLAYRDKAIRTTLLFDTGASSIVLHEDVAEQLGIDDFQESQGRGVGGIQIDTKTTKLNYAAVGPHKKENLRVDIVEYTGPADGLYNGLLGMNFIRGLKYTIDFDRQTIEWIP